MELTPIYLLSLCNFDFLPSLGNICKLNVEYVIQGMLFGIDKDLCPLALCPYISEGLVPSFSNITLIYFINSISILIILMEESGSISQLSETNEHTTHINNKAENNVKLKPTINIVYSMVTLDKEMFFIYNKNENPNENYLLYLLSIKASRLKRAQIEVNGRLYNGILRTSMLSGDNGGYKIPVKPTAYRTLVETHNLESNGRNLICRAGSVVIYGEN